VWVGSDGIPAAGNEDSYCTTEGQLKLARV
jgi:hypothetical protein